MVIETVTVCRRSSSGLAAEASILTTASDFLGLSAFSVESLAAELSRGLSEESRKRAKASAIVAKPVGLAFRLAEKTLMVFSASSR